jgi:hypothetical protein
MTRSAKRDHEGGKGDSRNQRTDECPDRDLGRCMITETYSRPSDRQDEWGHQEHPRAEQDHEDRGNPGGNSRVDRNLPEEGDRERHDQADEACADERDEFRW